MSLATVLRPSSPSQLNTVTQIRYSSRNSAASDHAMITGGRRNANSPRGDEFWHGTSPASHRFLRRPVQQGCSSHGVPRRPVARCTNPFARQPDHHASTRQETNSGIAGRSADHPRPPSERLTEDQLSRFNHQSYQSRLRLVGTGRRQAGGWARRRGGAGRWRGRRVVSRLGR